MSKILIDVNSVALSFLPEKISEDSSAPKQIGLIIDWLERTKSLYNDHEFILVSENFESLGNNPNPTINSFSQIIELWANQHGIEKYDSMNRSLDSLFSIAKNTDNAIIISNDPRAAGCLTESVSLLKPLTDNKYTKSDLLVETQGLKPSDIPLFLSLIGAKDFGIEGIAGVQSSLDLCKIANGDLNAVFELAKGKNSFDYTRIIQSKDKITKNLSKAKAREVQVSEHNFKKERDDNAKSKIESFLKSTNVRSKLNKELPDYPVEIKTITSSSDFDWLESMFKKAPAYYLNFERDEKGIFAACLSFKEGSSIIIPMNSLFGQSLDEEDVIKFISDRVSENRNLVTFSAIQLARDLNALKIQDYSIKADISCGSYLINTRNIINDVSDIQDETSKSIPSINEFCIREGGGLAQNTDQFKLFKLCSIRSDIAWRNSKSIFNTILSENLKEQYQNYEIRQSIISANMGEEGIKINLEGIKKYRSQILNKLEYHNHKIKEITGKDIDVMTASEVLSVFDQFGLKTGKTSTGQRSISENELKAIENKHPVVTHIISARSIKNVMGKQIDKLLSFVDDKGILRFKVFTNSTLTSRLSIREPDLQNSTDVMRGFMQPRDGYKFISFDYKQIEMVVLAYQSQEQRLINAFKEGKDVHVETASEVFQVDSSQVTDEQRKASKAINFGLIYGMSPMGLSMKLGISVSKANNYIHMYFKRLPNVLKFQENLIQGVKEKGYLKLISGRKITFPEINTQVINEKNAEERSCKNAPMQGTAAEIVKRAMVKAEDMIRDNNYDARIALQVHDELVFEVKEEIVNDFAKKAKMVLENALDIGVPLRVDMFIGQTLSKKISNSNNLTSPTP